MHMKAIEPLITNENTAKTTSRDYKQMKNEDLKQKMRSQNRLLVDEIPPFLQTLKTQISEKLKQEFHYDPSVVDYLIDVMGIPANDFNLIYELIAEAKKHLKVLNNKSVKTAPPEIYEPDSQEKELKQECFVKGPHVKHRYVSYF